MSQRENTEIKGTNLLILTGQSTLVRLVDHTTMTLVRSITISINYHSPVVVVPYSKVVLFTSYFNKIFLY